MKKTYYKVTLRVQNQAGVLARITTLLRKFQINIHSLDVAPIDTDERFSDIHMLIENPKGDVNVVMKKTESLIPVISATYKSQ